MLKLSILTALLSVTLLACGPESPEDSSNSCSVEQMEDGVLIECPDGTSAFMANPEDGVDGEDGLEGIHGVNGRETTVVVEDEPAGDNCEFGGKVVLVNNEVEEYLCNPRLIAECDVFYGDAIIETTADLAPFVGCKEITGNLSIGDLPTEQLSVLSSLERVGGTLQVYTTTRVTNLDFLANLEEVNFRVDIRGNENLIDISALQGLHLTDHAFADPATGGIRISQNPQLAACQVLEVSSSMFAPTGSPTVVGENLGTCD